MHTGPQMMSKLLYLVEEDVRRDPVRGEPRVGPQHRLDPVRAREYWCGVAPAHSAAVTVQELYERGLGLIALKHEFGHTIQSRKDANQHKSSGSVDDHARRHCGDSAGRGERQKEGQE